MSRIEINTVTGEVMTNLTADEYRLIQDYRKEQILINEENEKSSNQKAVEGIEKLKDYLKNNHISFDKDPITNAIKCMHSRLGMLRSNNYLADKIRAVLDEN